MLFTTTHMLRLLFLITFTKAYPISVSSPSAQSLAKLGYSILDSPPSDQRPWPSNGATTWCETDSTDLEVATTLLESGYQLWTEAGLGSPSSVGPSLAYAGFKCSTLRDLNPALYSRVLHVQMDESLEARSDIGFVHGGRNIMVFDPRPELYRMPLEAAVAHELGHVWGLHHQHQRPEIWAHGLVGIQCRNLARYDLFASKGCNMTELCYEGVAAGRAGFSEVTTLLPLEPFPEPLPPLRETKVDWDSIMLYGSEQASADVAERQLWWDETGKSHSRYEYVSAVLIRKDRGLEELVEQPHRPSAADVAKLRQLYPQTPPMGVPEAVADDGGLTLNIARVGLGAWRQYERQLRSASVDSKNNEGMKHRVVILVSIGVHFAAGVSRWKGWRICCSLLESAVLISSAAL